MKTLLSITLAGAFLQQNVRSQTWSSVGGGMNGLVAALYTDATDSLLYAGGQFTAAGGNPARNVARWNGTAWSPMGQELNALVTALTRYKGILYAGGQFSPVFTTELPANYIAQWNGSAWTPLNGIYGFDNQVLALAVYNGDLYIGGPFAQFYSSPPDFTSTTSHTISRWNGSAMTAMPGFNHYGFPDGDNNSIRALAVYNGELYAAGHFDSAHGDPGNNIAKWNGSSWSAVGPGLDDRGSALIVYGDELYVGGSFSTAGGIPARGIAKWNGVSWSAVGNQDLRHIATLTIYNGNLYAGGEFSSAVCDPQHIARLAGNNWVKVGDEVSTRTRALTPFNGDLIAGGDFASTRSGSTVLNDIARYHPGAVPDFLNVSTGPDAHIYVGYTPTNLITRTASASGGTAPYFYSWTLNRPLLCNSIGDECFTAESCLNNSCGSSLPPSCVGTVLNVCLVDTANLTLAVTDADGCLFTSSATIFVEDVRCSAGNSGDHKVKVCHRGKTICVDEHAVSAHLAHGDSLGLCP